ncbi:MAG TPA: ankyrin repeat domain-containing protein [Verrucomicrobiae bacterium]|nr:ankyrin repeat domain-containing protein [Verrucomicrobiae bacterium]
MPTHAQRLIHAVRTGNHARLRDLLAHSTDVDARSAAGRTALHAAAEEGDLEAARILIESGAEVNARTNNGQTPLHLAAGYGGFCDLADLDRDRADPCNRQRHHPTHPEVAEAITSILKERNSRLPDQLGPTDTIPSDRKAEIFLAMLEAFSDLRELHRAIVSRGVDVDQVDPHFAEFLRGRPRYLRMVEYLLEAKADINALDEADNSPLHFAVELGQPEMVELLLKRGARIPSPSMDDSTQCLVSLALDYSKVEVAEILVRHGVPFNPGGLHLHEATGNARKEVVLWLLGHGADINHTSDDGNTPIMDAAMNGHHEMVACLLEQRPQIHYCNQQGEGLLHCAARWYQCLAVVLPLGLPLNQQSASGATPLHAAAQSGDPSAVQALIAAGASVNVQDHTGNTPLHCIFISDEFRPDIEFPLFLQLVAGGADRSIRNKEGKTAFDLAVQWRYPEEYHLLLRPGPTAMSAASFVWLGEPKYRELLPDAMVSVEIESQLWPSCEHYLHALKTTDLAVREQIRQAGSVRDALHRLHDSKVKPPKTLEWARFRDDAMRAALLARARQHPAIGELLLSTGDAQLISDGHCDSYWTSGPDVPFNAIGRMLMSVRNELRDRKPS